MQNNGQAGSNLRIELLLEECIRRNASDLHLQYGLPPILRIDGVLTPVAGTKQLSEEKKQRELCVQVPVNLRRHFPSETLRNFVVCIRIKLNPAMGLYSFEELVRLVQLQMQMQNEPKFLNSMMTQNLNVERNPVLRAVPLWIKDLGVGISFYFTAEQTTTALLSNIGRVELPEEMYPHIEKYMFFTGPGQQHGGAFNVEGQ